MKQVLPALAKPLGSSENVFFLLFCSFFVSLLLPCWLEAGSAVGAASSSSSSPAAGRERKERSATAASRGSFGAGGGGGSGGR